MTPKAVPAAPFVVRVKLDDAELAASCRPAAPAPRRSSPIAIKASHIIRKVFLRQIAIMNYVNPF